MHGPAGAVLNARRMLWTLTSELNVSLLRLYYSKSLNCCLEQREILGCDSDLYSECRGFIGRARGLVHALLRKRVSTRMTVVGILRTYARQVVSRDFFSPFTPITGTARTSRRTSKGFPAQVDAPDNFFIQSADEQKPPRQDACLGFGEPRCSPDAAPDFPPLCSPGLEDWVCHQFPDETNARDSILAGLIMAGASGAVIRDLHRM